MSDNVSVRSQFEHSVHHFVDLDLDPPRVQVCNDVYMHVKG